jgi:hypothetical protein
MKIFVTIDKDMLKKVINYGEQLDEKALEFNV